jgi:hypothetical protein
MGGIRAWMLAAAAAILTGLGMSGTVAANAAQLPPSEECTATMHESLKDFFREYVESSSKKEEREADRRMIERLYEAGCVSDPEPLLRPGKIQLRRHSAECATAAEIVGNRWRKPTIRLKSRFREYRARKERLVKRARQVTRRISRLSRRGASARRLRPLRRARARISKRLVVTSYRFSRRALRIVQPRAFETLMTYYELFSLRCVGMESLDDPGNAVGPVEKTLVRNRMYLSLSVFIATITAFFEVAEEEGFAHAARSLEPRKVLGAGLTGLPMPPVPGFD